MGSSNKQKGFTLVELMIVLVIIAIVASVAAMSALAARVRANEANAISALKAVASASEMYQSVQSSYPNNLSVLGPDYLAQDLASGQKSGYSFTLTSGNQGATYTCVAVPITLNYTGVKSYCISLLNAIHAYQNAPALSADGSACPSGGTIMS
ncbi:MAG: prepilin-type N-terminal cleavage/methylation domain-containing protein [Candidatus Omnitrophica bacterium]|nr:prepilin-type N-terminal cleavage/methylation domain-containing protein [Candidatus Omnitrophota bacterium]